jgi:hypothetical protein
MKKKCIERRENSAIQVTIKRPSRTSGPAKNVEPSFGLPEPVDNIWRFAGGEGAFHFGANEFQFVALRVPVNGQMRGPVQMNRSDGPPKPLIFARNSCEFVERLVSFPSDVIFGIRNINYILDHASHTFLWRAAHC